MSHILVVLLALTLITPPQAPLTYEGYAPHYSRGLMQRVAKKRGLVAEHGIASPIFPLRSMVEVCSTKTGENRCITAMVVDVSAPADRKRHIQRRQWAELSFEDKAYLCGPRATKMANRYCTITVTQAQK